MRRAPLLMLLLAACGDPAGDYPRLLPLEAITTAPLPAHALDAAASPAPVNARLRSRADALAARMPKVAAGTDPALIARAAALRGRPLAAQSDADLLARAAALRARAAALAAAPLS